MNHEKKRGKNDSFSLTILRQKLEAEDGQPSSITPRRPLLSRDRTAETLFIDVSPLTDCNSRSEQSFLSIVESCTFSVDLPQFSRLNDTDNDENSYRPIYVQKKARPAPSTTWKPPIQPIKSSKISKIDIESSLAVPPPPPPQHASIVSFQPAIRARIPFNLSSISTIDKQAHAYVLWLNSLFTPVDFLAAQTTITSNERMPTKTLKFLAESNCWHALRDRAHEVFARDIQPIAAKISADIDIDQCRINPKPDMNFSSRTVSRQALLNYIGSFNRVWFRLGMEVLFPINIDNYPQMKLAIEQHLIQSGVHAGSPSNETSVKKSHLHQTKMASTQIRATIKHLIVLILFLERAKQLRLIEKDPCLYTTESKFKSTRDAIDVLSRDFISSDTNLLRRLKLAGYEPTYRQTSLDEYHYLIRSNDENRLFEDLRDGIRLIRCTQILLASTDEHVARLDLSTKFKCPVVNLVHKLLNIDLAFELLATYGHVNLTGISNRDIMNGHKSRTLELLWRIYIACYLPKYLSPVSTIEDELSILTEGISKFCTRSVERHLVTVDIVPLQKQHIDATPLIHLLIKWVQLICAHYKFWLYDLQESFADGRAFLFIISYYLPSLCDYQRDIKHLTTLATCQTRDEHIQFNYELGQPQQQQLLHLYEKNVKANFRSLEEYIKQICTFPSDLIKYEHYAKDLPDERCTIMILAMLAHDLLFLNHNVNHERDFRHQPLFEELMEKYDVDEECATENEKFTARRYLNPREVEITRASSIDSSELSIFTDLPHEDTMTLNPSMSSYTMDDPRDMDHPIPIVQFQSEIPSTERDEISLHLLASPSVRQTMDHDILDRLELVSHSTVDGDEKSFDPLPSNSTAIIEHRRSSMSATISLDDFVELEKTIENEEMRNHADHTSLFLTDQTALSEVHRVPTNKSDEVPFADPAHTKMLKDALTLFLIQQQTVERKQSMCLPDQRMEHTSNEELARPLNRHNVEPEVQAALVLQAHWRGHHVRLENARNDHPVVALLNQLRLAQSRAHSSLTVHERMMQIVQEFSEAPSSSLTAYLHLLRDMRPIVVHCMEIRYLIAEQGLLRLFLILIKCCNRSEPSTILLSELLSFLHLFTAKRDLTMKLIDQHEHVKDFVMLLLRYYQNNGHELFEQICFLLQSIVEDREARQLLRSNRSFTDAIEYVYKRLFNKTSTDAERYRQQVRSTPKKSSVSSQGRATLFGQSSHLHGTPKKVRSSIHTQESVLKTNLVSIEKFMKVFYAD